MQLLTPRISLLRHLAGGAAIRRLCSVTSSTIESPKLERIADELLALTAEERGDYSALLRLRLGLADFGPSAASFASGGSSATAPAEEIKVEEKTAFDVKIEKFDAASKIKVIKEVRAVTELGLKEAKELVEKAPVIVKKGVTKEEAESIAAKLKEAGAAVVLE